MAQWYGATDLPLLPLTVKCSVCGALPEKSCVANGRLCAPHIRRHNDAYNQRRQEIVPWLREDSPSGDDSG